MTYGQRRAARDRVRIWEANAVCEMTTDLHNIQSNRIQRGQLRLEFGLRVGAQDDKSQRQLTAIPIFNADDTHIGNIGMGKQVSFELRGGH